MPQQSRLSGALNLIFAQAIVLVLGYVTHLWIGKVLGPAPYGIYGVTLSIQTIVGLILSLGVPVAVSRFVAQDEKHAHSILKQAIRIQAVIAIGVAFLTVTTASFVANLLDDSSLTPLIRFVGFVLFFQAFYPIYTQFFSGMHRFSRQALLTNVYAIAKVAGAIILLYFFGVYGAFAGFGVGGAIAAGLGWIWARNIGGHAEKKLPLKSFLSFAGLYVVVLICLQLLISIDLFMVKAYLHDDVLTGYYNAAVTLSRIPYFLLQALAFVLLPSVAALTKEGASRDKAALFIRDTLRYLIAIIVPGVTLAAATSKSLIIIFFNENYLPAASVLTILMIGLGSLAFFLLLTNIAAGAGKTKVAVGITLAAVVASAILGYILIPHYGLIGAAMQTTIVGLASLGILGSYTFYTFRIPVPWRSIINIIVATAVAVSITYLWEPGPLFLPLLYVAFGVVYIVILAVLWEIRRTDLERVSQVHPLVRKTLSKFVTLDL